MSDKELYYLRFAADFWKKMYGNESLFIEGALKATADTIKSLYFAFLQRSLPDDITTFPIFQEQFWNVIELLVSDGKAVDINLNETTDPDLVEFIKYELDEPYSEIPFLYNTIYDPSVVFQSGKESDLKKRIDDPGLQNSLVIDQEYINKYDGNIINATQIIEPNKSFIAASSDYSLEDQNSTGYLIFNKPYFIKIIRNDDIDTDSVELNLTSYVYFRKENDPFLNPSIATKASPTGEIYMALFAPKVYLDYQELLKIYGSIVGVYSESSIDYRDFISGIIDLYQKGPMTQALNIAINVVNGYPVASEDENITSIEIQENYFILRSDRGNVYNIKRKVIKEYELINSQLVITNKAFPRLLISNPNYYRRQPSTNPITNQPIPYRDFTNIDNYDLGIAYTTFWKVKQFEGFIDQLKIVDYKDQDKWWLEKIVTGNTIDLFVDLSEENKRRLPVIDYLFEKHLKYNTFGVFIDSRITSNFKGITDLIKIIDDTKPSSKTFLVNEQDLTIFSEMESNTKSVTFDTGFELTTEHWFPPVIGMDMIGANANDLLNPHPVSFGAKFEEWGSSYDFLKMEIEINPSLDDPNSPVSYFGTEEYKLPVIGDINSFSGSHYGMIMDYVVFDVVDLDTIMQMPDNFAIVSFSYNSVSVSWDSVPNAESYELQLKDDNTNTVISIINVGNVLSHSFNNILEQNTPYSLYIKSIGLMSESQYSASLEFTSSDYVLAAPANLTNDPPAYNSAQLFWDAVTDATSYNITVTDLSDNSLVVNNVNIPSGTSYLVENLIQNKNYEWFVVANSLIESSNPSDLAYFTTADYVLAAPEIIAYSDITTESITLNWNPVPGATYYKLWLYDSTNDVLILDALDIGNVTTFNATGLTDNSNHSYKVTAGNLIEESAYSMTDTFTTNELSPYLFKFLFDEPDNTTVIYDADFRNNDATIIETIPDPDNTILNLSFEDDSGLILNDLSDNNNDAIISDI